MSPETIQAYCNGCAFCCARNIPCAKCPACTPHPGVCLALTPAAELAQKDAQLKALVEALENCQLVIHAPHHGLHGDCPYPVCTESASALRLAGVLK